MTAIERADDRREDDRHPMAPNHLKNWARQLVRDCLTASDVIVKEHAGAAGAFGPREVEARAWFLAPTPDAFLLRLVIRTSSIEALRKRILDYVGDRVPRIDTADVDGEMHIQIDIGSPGRPQPLAPN